MGSIIKFIKKFFFSDKKTNHHPAEEQGNYNNKQYKEIDFNIHDCMVPLKDVVLVDIKSSFQELLKAMKYDFHKNLDADEQQPAEFALIYHEYTDDIIGIVYSKDLIFRIGMDIKKDGCDFFFSSVVFASMNTSIENAMNLMNKKSTPILLVVDNKGITLGVATKESFVDFAYNYEIVHKYFEEYNQDNKITVDGTLLLKHIPTDWYIKEFDSCYASGTRTIGGFLGYYTGVIPKQDEEITVNKLTFKVLEGNERFVKTILITRHGTDLKEII